MSEKPIRVLLVDDHHLVRRGFRRMLEDEDDIEVAGEASDGKEAVERFRELTPDVVVMDFALPSINGAAAAREILKEAPAGADPDIEHALRGQLCPHLPRRRGARLPA